MTTDMETRPVLLLGSVPLEVMMEAADRIWG
jgi:hypothetical protein